MMAWVRYIDFFFQKWLLGLVLLLWLIFQICLVYYGAYSILVSDPGFYVYYATECINNGTMYPDYTNYYDEYIFNPGYINFLILWIKLFGSVKLVPYFNILLNVGIVYLLYVISKQLTCQRIAYLTIYVFLLIPSFPTIALHLYSDQLFIAFILLAILPFVKSSKYDSHFALSGVGIAIAQWIRPLSLAWQFPCILFLLYKKEYKKCFVYVSFYAIICLVIATATHQNFPDYLYKAKTGGVNMIMGANDMANGQYCGDVRRDKKGLGYLEDVIDESHTTNVKLWIGDSTYAKRRNARYTYNQYDSIYVHRSLNWIKSNPVKWLKVSIMKIYWTFYDVPSFFYSYGGNLTIPNKMYSIIYQKSSILYLGILIASVLSVFVNVKKSKYIFLIYIPAMCYMFSIFMTCGAPRYSLPLIPFVCILASGFLYECSIFILRKCKSKLI